MSTGDHGLEVFLQDEASTGPVSHSVFSAVDQRSMLERLDAMEDEELSDGFFDEDYVSAEQASTSSLDVGIKTLVGAATASPGGPSDGPTTSVPGVPDTAEAHRAFVLGGPARISA